MSVVKSQRHLTIPNTLAVFSLQCSTFVTWQPVRTLRDSNVETFRKAAFNPSLPAKLPKDSCAKTPALTKWFQAPWPTFNSSYLGRFGRHLVPLELTSPPLTPNTGSVFQRAEAPFSIFLQWAGQADADSPKRLYVAQASLDRLPKPLQDDLPTPELVAQAGSGDVYDASIWLGVAPTYTPLHRDPNPNLYLQLAGHKVARLLQPEAGQSIFATVQAALGTNSSSRFRGDEMMRGQEKDILEAEIWHGRTPVRSGDIGGFEADLESGEVLFIPQGWWHSVKSIGKGHTASVCLIV